MADASVPSGIIDTPANVGGWPVLNSTPAPQDTDHDGLPDAWEIAHSLDPFDPADGARLSSDGQYTNLEIYLNALAM